MNSRCLQPRQIADLVACHNETKQEGDYWNANQMQYGPAYQNLDQMWSEALNGPGASWYAYPQTDWSHAAGPGNREPLGAPEKFPAQAKPGKGGGGSVGESPQARPGDPSYNATTPWWANPNGRYSGGQPPTSGNPSGGATVMAPGNGGVSMSAKSGQGITGMSQQEDPATSGLILPPAARELAVQADRRTAEARAGMVQKGRDTGKGAGGDGKGKGRDPRTVEPRVPTGGPGRGGGGGQTPQTPGGGGGAGAYPTAARAPIVSTRRPNQLPTGGGDYPGGVTYPPETPGGTGPREPIVTPPGYTPRPDNGPPDRYTFGSGGAMGNRNAAGGKLFKTYNDLINDPDIDEQTRNDMLIGAAKEARARYAGAGEQIERRGAATGATAGTPAALAYLARNEAGTVADTNRGTRLALEAERQRRRELGISGMSDLYGTETGFTSSLMQGRAGTAQKPYINAGAGHSSGTSGGIDFGALLSMLG